MKATTPEGPRCGRAMGDVKTQIFIDLDSLDSTNKNVV